MLAASMTCDWPSFTEAHCLGPRKGRTAYLDLVLKSASLGAQDPD